MCREANLASSSSWMYITYKSLLIDLYYSFLISLFLTKRGRKICLIWVYFEPFVDEWQKGGEVFEMYMHVFLTLLLKGRRIYVYAYMFCFANRRKRVWLVLCLLACLSPYICIHVYVLHCYILLFIVMHELRGSFFEALL